MEQKVKARYVRMGPRKINIVAGLIRKKKVDEAMNILRFVTKAASPVLSKLLKSAVAAAERRPGTDPAALFVKELRADSGPLVRNAKRFIPRAMGRASKIHVRTTHLTLIVSDGKPSAGITAEA
jgi:large subunit ribosomal protein L22